MRKKPHKRTGAKNSIKDALEASERIRNELEQNAALMRHENERLAALSAAQSKAIAGMAKSLAEGITLMKTYLQRTAPMTEDFDAAVKNYVANGYLTGRNAGRLPVTKEREEG